MYTRLQSEKVCFLVQILVEILSPSLSFYETVQYVSLLHSLKKQLMIKIISNYKPLCIFSKVLRVILKSIVIQRCHLTLVNSVTSMVCTWSNTRNYHNKGIFREVFDGRLLFQLFNHCCSNCLTIVLQILLDLKGYCQTMCAPRCKWVNKLMRMSDSSNCRLYT